MAKPESGLASDHLNLSCKSVACVGTSVGKKEIREQFHQQALLSIGVVCCVVGYLHILYLPNLGEHPVLVFLGTGGHIAHLPSQLPSYPTIRCLSAYWTDQLWHPSNPLVQTKRSVFQPS